MDKKLQDKLNKRIKEGTLRSLSSLEGFVDFYSNDYLGFSTIEIKTEIRQKFGSTGSRLISGTSNEALDTESFLADFFTSEAALIFNSGYDANLGFFSSVPQKGDTVIYDEYIHASIRDGIRLSFADSFSFKHNDTSDLEKKLSRTSGVVYIVVESLYSMDGDLAPLEEIIKICSINNSYLIVDEAHACGVFGEKGKGIVSALGIELAVFARIITFGKAYGSHGAAILTKNELKNYLVNFSRSFIYTTALPPDTYIRIKEIVGHSELDERKKDLQNVIDYFVKSIGPNKSISDIQSPIQLIKIGDVQKTKEIAECIQNVKLAVKPIYSPTVPIGSEGLRICIHAFNTKDEIDTLVSHLRTN